MHKQFYKVTFLLLSVVFSNADDINKQIEALKEATPRERVEMMNSLKEKIAAMNEHERGNAIETLQETLKKETGTNQNYFEHRMNQNSSTGMRNMQQRGMQSAQPKYQGGKK